MQLSLYYRDAQNAIVPIASNTITYHAADFPTTGSLSLRTTTVATVPVQQSDAWAGKQIGIEIKSVNGTGQGYWDVDSAALTVVPEPATGWLLLRLRRGAGVL